MINAEITKEEFKVAIIYGLIFGVAMALVSLITSKIMNIERKR